MIGKKAHVAAFLAMAAVTLAACAGQERATEGLEGEQEEPLAAVEFVQPLDGEVLESPVRVVLEVAGLMIVPAGEQQPRSGHHHLLVDVDEPAAGTPVPSTGGYMHLGQAQTDFEIELEPGEHRLIALVGDFAHVPLNPNVADTITVTIR